MLDATEKKQQQRKLLTRSATVNMTSTKLDMSRQSAPRSRSESQTILPQRSDTLRKSSAPNLHARKESSEAIVVVRRNSGATLSPRSSPRNSPRERKGSGVLIRSAPLSPKSDTRDEEGALDRILEASLRAYRAEKLHKKGIINFMTQINSPHFCFVCEDSGRTAYGSEGAGSLQLIRHLTLTEVKKQYATFKECHIYRIIKLCPTCYENYLARRVTEPNPLVPICAMAYNLFETL